MTINNGKYSASIHNAQGRYMVTVTYENECVPGIDPKFYATHKAAERGAARLLTKAAA